MSTKNTLVIGLTGLADSGAHVLADYLVKERGFTRLSFAGPLKDMLRTLDPVVQESVGFTPESNYSGKTVHLSDLAHLSEDSLKASKYGAEYRRLLGVLEAECLQAVDPEFWTKAALAQVTSEGNYVFDDVTSSRQASAIKDLPQGMLWCIQPEGSVHGEHGGEAWAGTLCENRHVSNNGTPGELFAQADNLIDQWQNTTGKSAESLLKRLRRTFSTASTPRKRATS